MTTSSMLSIQMLESINEELRQRIESEREKKRPRHTPAMLLGLFGSFGLAVWNLLH